MFSGEIASGLIDNVTAKPGMAVLAVVGDGMAGTPGIAARVFSALAAAEDQRRGDRAGLVGAQHLVRGQRRRRGRSGAVRARGVPAVEDRRRPRRRDACGPTSCCSGSAGSAARSPIRLPRRADGQPAGARRRPARSIGLHLRAARHLTAPAARSGAEEGRRRAARVARRPQGERRGSADDHGRRTRCRGRSSST